MNVCNHRHSTFVWGDNQISVQNFSPIHPPELDLKVFFGSIASIRPHVFLLQLPEISTHGAVDDEVEAGVEGDEEGGDAGHDEHPAGEAEAGVLDLRDDEHLVEVEHEAGDGRGEEDEDHGEQHHLLVGTLFMFSQVFTNQHRMRLIGVPFVSF